ncbi:MAG: response regulator transcription factor [Lachnospiraceae bacterium]|nr:response regulator transcription factor [Lachnospiraceae bacterium]
MKVLIIDDDPLVALSLKTILDNNEDIEITAIGNSGKEALELYEACQPDILLMDIRMEHMTGLEAGELLLKKFPDCRILFLTTFSDEEYIVKALHIGAKGYILKQAFESIAPALRAVMQGQTVFDGQVITKFSSLMQNKNSGRPSLPPQITDKEFQLIELVAKGLNNREIADTLFLSEGTVRNYLSTILDKLELRDRTQLAVYYYMNLN